MRQERVIVNNNNVEDAGTSVRNVNVFHGDGEFDVGSAQRAESIHISQLCKQEPKLECGFPKKKGGAAYLNVSRKPCDDQ